jgi:hypothetical protein
VTGGKILQCRQMIRIHSVPARISPTGVNFAA